ncbi:hypothetical protein PLICRDRAFT_613867 [Plicaturopsis crispa FD-325 SS-3]|nr:hypothetical protein PLICRDRAFT_613867 [Plicaturopsis crispa FD-325 SS-3]
MDVHAPAESSSDLGHTPTVHVTESLLSSSTESSLDLHLTTSPAPSSESHLSVRPTLGRRTSTVQFAPLPEVEPRERRHTLGVAARSRFIKERRLARQHAEMEDEQEGWMQQQPRRRAAPQIAEQRLEPPVSLTKLVRTTSRSFLRRVQIKRSDAEDFVESLGKYAGVDGRAIEIYRDEFSPEEEEAGGVWEEEIGEDILARIQKSRSVSNSTLDASCRKGVLEVGAVIPSTALVTTKKKD